jgi:hypothetical protein
MVKNDNNERTSCVRAFEQKANDELYAIQLDLAALDSFNNMSSTHGAKWIL